MNGLWCEGEERGHDCLDLKKSLLTAPIMVAIFDKAQWRGRVFRSSRFVLDWKLRVHCRKL